MLRQDTIRGHRALWIESDLLSIAVLPDKGADVLSFIYRPSGVDALLKTPNGLQPPGTRPPTEFLDNYEGGWQELFPSANDACEYRGAQMPFHGEVAILPWSVAVERDDARETAVRFSVHCRRTPFLLQRTMRVRAGEPTVQIESRVLNDSDERKEFVWGHHVALGGDFLEAGCRVETPAGTIVTAEALYEETARLAPGQHTAWPYARGRQGESIDLRDVPGPQAHSHDDAFLGDLAAGTIAVMNPRLGLTFSLAWDVALFAWIVLWQPYGGADLPPLTGTYGLGIEPWSAPCNLAEASERGIALGLEGRASLSTTLRATFASTAYAVG